MNVTTQPVRTKTDETENCLSDLEKKSCSEPRAETPSLCGGTLSTTQASKESIAPRSETKAGIGPATSYAKRIRLLIASGLIAGITPTSIRERSAQRTLDFVLSQPDGVGADGQREGS